MNNTELKKQYKILQAENTRLKKQNASLIIKVNECYNLIKQLNAKWKQKNKIIEEMKPYKIYMTEYNKIVQIIKPLISNEDTPINVIHTLYKCHNKFLVAINFIERIIVIIKQNNLFTPNMINIFDTILNVLNTNIPYENILNIMKNIQNIYIEVKKKEDVKKYNNITAGIKNNDDTTIIILTENNNEQPLYKNDNTYINDKHTNTIILTENDNMYINNKHTKTIILTENENNNKQPIYKNDNTYINNEYTTLSY